MADATHSGNVTAQEADAFATQPADQSIREVPLNYWLGHKKIAAIKLAMSVENWAIDPFSSTLPSAADLSQLKPDLDGIYRPSEPLSGPTPSLDVSKSCIRYIESTFDRRYIDMSVGFDAYMAEFTGKTRSTIKRKVRKFEKSSGGKIKWSVHRSVEEMEQFHALAREVSKSTYQERIFDAGLPDDDDFVAELRELARTDQVRGFILFLDGRPISYLYLPVVDDRVIYGYLGFEPTAATHSPGVVLQVLALEVLFSEDRYKVFDFTEGDGGQKKLFSTAERYCGNVFYLKPTIRNRLIVWGHIAINKVSKSLDGMITKTGLKSHLRRTLRGQRA